MLAGAWHLVRGCALVHPCQLLLQVTCVAGFPDGLRFISGPLVLLGLQLAQYLAVAGASLITTDLAAGGQAAARLSPQETCEDIYFGFLLRNRFNTTLHYVRGPCAVPCSAAGCNL